MSEPRLRDTWLVRKHEASVLGILYATFTAIWFAVGWLLTHPLKNSWIVHTDQSISRWFVDRRTPTMNSLTSIGSMMADTMVKIIVTVVVAIVMLIVWKRWLEPLMVVIPLILEALTFITVTTLVGRPDRTFPGWRPRPSAPASRRGTWAQPSSTLESSSSCSGTLAVIGSG